jgi:hypothetical protein
MVLLLFEYLLRKAFSHPIDMLIVLRVLHRVCLLVIGLASSFLVTLNEMIELLEVKEAVLDSMVILPLDDKIVGVHLVLLQPLPLVLTHQLGQSTVELTHILRKELPIAEHLLE